MALGKNIRRHRNAHSLTLEQLSERSGVDVGTISALDNRDSVRSRYASAIARGLGMSPATGRGQYPGALTVVWPQRGRVTLFWGGDM